MSVLDGVVAWVAPNRVISGALENQSAAPGLAAYLLTSVATSQLVFCFYDSSHMSSSALVGSAYVAFVGLLSLLVYTSGWKTALNASEVEGNRLSVEFFDLFRCHLYTCPIMMALGFFAVVTSEPFLIVLLILSIFRTLELQARVIRDSCNISYGEALKGTVLITLVHGGISAALLWALLTYVF